MWLAVLHNLRNTVMWWAVLHMWLAVLHDVRYASNVIGCVTLIWENAVMWLAMLHNVRSAVMWSQ